MYKNFKKLCTLFTYNMNEFNLYVYKLKYEKNHVIYIINNLFIYVIFLSKIDEFVIYHVDSI